MLSGKRRGTSEQRSTGGPPTSFRVDSALILAELRRTYQDPYYARRLTPALVEAEAIVVELIMPLAGVATHPEDDLVLSTAASAAADYLGTRDRQLLRLGMFHGARIVHPADLTDLLGPSSLS